MAGPQLRGRIGVDGEREFKAAMKDAGNAIKLVDSELQVLSAQFKAGENSMEQYQRQQELLTNKLQAQKSQVATMESVLAAVKAKYGENSDEATKYAVQLNKAKAAVAQTEGELERCNGKLDEFRQGMDKAGGASEDLGSSLNKSEAATKDQGEAAETAGEKNDKLKAAAAAAGAVMKGAVVAGAKAAAAAIAALSAAAGKGIVDLTQMGTSYQQAANQLSAQTGANGQELQQLSGIAQDVFRNNFGENIGEVNEALAVTKTNTGLVGDELKTATESGFLLRDTFGFEFQESSRTARTLMKNFGLSADEAYNLIAAGAQRGANQNGDMLDVLAEYGPMYAQMGMSADQMMTSLIKGNEAGVFSIDKVGDAMKEFSIRCVDGSETTKAAMQAIGLDAGAMAQQFAMGGENARHAFQTTVEAIMSIEDPVKRSQTAVQLFGTQFEDLGPEILPILAEMAAGGELTAEALEQIANVRYDDFSSSAQGFMRLVQAEFLPTAQLFSAIAKGVADDARMALMDGFQPADVRAIGESVAGALVEGITAVQDLMDDALPVFADVVDVIGDTLTTLLPALIDTILPAAMTLLDGLLGAVSSNMGPLINTATNLVTSLAGFLSSNANKLITAARSLLSGLVRGVSPALPQLVPAAVSIIGELAAGLVEAVPELVAQIPAIFGGLIDGIASMDWLALGKRLLNAIKSGLASIGSTMQTLFEEGKQLVSEIDWASVGSAILNGATSLLDAAGTWLSGLFSKAWEAVAGLSWGDIGSAILSGATSVFDAAGSWLSGLFGGGKDAASGLSWGDIGSAILSGATSVFDAAGSWLSGLFGGGKDAASGLSWGDVGSAIHAGATGALDAAGGWLSGLFSAGKTASEGLSWSDVGTTILTGVTGAIDTAGAFLTGGFSAGKAAVEAIDWAGVGTTIGTGVNGVIDTAGAFLSGAFEAAKTTIETIDWAGIGTTISTGVNGVIDTAGAWLSGSFEAAKTAIEGIDWSGIGTTISTGVNGVIDTAGAFLSGAFEAAKTTIETIDWAGIGTMISTGVNGVIDTAGAWLSGSFEAAKTTIETIDWAGIGTTISTGVNSVIDTAGAWLSGSFEAAKTAIEGIDWSGLGATISSGLDSALDVLGKIGASIWDTICGWFGGGEKKKAEGDANSTGVDLAGQMADGISDGTAAMEAASAAAAATCVTAFRTTFGAEDVGGEWITNIASGISAAQASLTAMAQLVADNASKKLASVLSPRAGMSIGTNFAGNLASGLYSRQSSVASAASGLGAAATATLWGAVGPNGSKFVAIGDAISTGVANGITAGRGKIVEAAKEAARSAYTSACKELEINSPSRKGRYVGSNYIESIAMGMDDKRKQVTAAAASVARDANSTTQQTLQVQMQTLDYDRIGRSVARANRDAGLGNAVMLMDKRAVGWMVEPTVMHAGQARSKQSVSGRGNRFVLT